MRFAKKWSFWAQNHGYDLGSCDSRFRAPLRQIVGKLRQTFGGCFGTPPADLGQGPTRRPFRVRKYGYDLGSFSSFSGPPSEGRFCVFCFSALHCELVRFAKIGLFSAIFVSSPRHYCDLVRFAGLGPPLRPLRRAGFLAPSSPSPRQCSEVVASE